MVIPVILTVEGADQIENHTYQTTRDGTNSILSISVPDTIYQDKSLVFYLASENLEASSILFRVTNGAVQYCDQRDLERVFEDPELFYHYDGFASGDLLDDKAKDAAGFLLIPGYIDRDFEMVLEIEVIKGSEVLFSETHSFLVIGEPIVVEGYDPVRDDDLISNVLILAMISVAGWLIFFTLVFLFKMFLYRRGV